jgi:uncharacterized protein (TIGR03437 family)
MKCFFLILGSIGLAAAQPYSCSTTSATTIVRVESLTERIGDIVLNCTGVPSSTISVNLSVQLNATVTNRISSGNIITGTILTIDNGAGPQAVTVQPLLLSPSNLVWNGVPLTYSAQGALAIRIADIRVNANGAGLNQEIIATLGSSGSILITQSQLVVAVPETSLYAGFSSTLICAQSGSPLPGAPFGFASLIQEGTAFGSTRVTEGFSGAFSPKSAAANLNADTGTRFIVRYTGFPQAAQLFVPNAVAGSDAVQPTAGGDFGLPASGGSYAPSTGGSLLLSLVSGADSTGAGGSLVYTPGAVGSGTVTFDAVTQLPIVNGSAYAVYEVVDSNQFRVESAQFPTFLGLAPNAVTTAVQTGESVTYAPVSTVFTASTNAPIPRFVAIQPQSDCSIVGDCGAAYYPQLSVSSNPLQFTIPAGAPNQVQGLPVLNSGSGVLYWSASVNYTSTNGGGWLTISPTSGMNRGSIEVYANPGNLPVGTYQATITISAGSAGQQIVPVTLAITQATAPGPTITSVVNAASFAQAPVVAGSLATIMGSALTGSAVSASFNGVPATVLFSNATQINLLVPQALASLTSAQLSVTVAGRTSLPVTVPVAQFEPGIFSGAVLNQDSTVNLSTNGAAGGSIIYFYATGLSGSGTITARIGTTEITNLYYAGPAPGYPGVQQINLAIPAGLGGMTTELYACGTSAGTEVCSVPVPLTLK